MNHPRFPIQGIIPSPTAADYEREVALLRERAHGFYLARNLNRSGRTYELARDFARTARKKRWAEETTPYGPLETAARVRQAGPILKPETEAAA